MSMQKPTVIIINITAVTVHGSTVIESYNHRIVGVEGDP